MSISEIEAKSILRKQKKIDSWFVSRYGMNLYRGCLHNCSYCDGRAEKYQVDGIFGKDVIVKKNASELLTRELDPKRKRLPWKKAYVLVGGGVNDAHQAIEKKYELTKRALEIIKFFKHPAHVLTKSTLVARDIELLKQINQRSAAIVSFSFSTVDPKISSVFEPCVPSPQKRLETIKKIKDAGIPCGMFMMPVIPFISDTEEQMEATISAAKEAGVDFIVFGGMTLKPGRQKEYFLDVLKNYENDLSIEYDILYGQNNEWGHADGRYYGVINQQFDKLASKYKMPKRIPLKLYKDILDDNDLATVMLEQMDYLNGLKGRKSPFGFAAYNISQLKEPLSNYRNSLEKIKGVGGTTANVLREILDKKTSFLYEKMMND